MDRAAGLTATRAPARLSATAAARRAGGEFVDPLTRMLANGPSSGSTGAYCGTGCQSAWGIC
jgi:hypothetical protein